MGELFSAKNIYAAICILAGLSPVLLAIFDVCTKRKKR